MRKSLDFGTESDFFALYNSAKRAATDNISSQFVYYLNLTSNHGKASDCIDCKQCEKVCPQHLKITEYLKDVAAEFEAGGRHYRQNKDE